uniref:Ig-like domain-containing protein n=1 Tax=Fundulus heteroclitus TaxID=8078 RepID=A0A3Q2PDU9_FUNHE
IDTHKNDFLLVFQILHLMCFFPVADTEVSCVFSESCMLPCQFPFGSEPLIHWMRVSAGDSLALSYYKDQDQLGYQVENFKNRTSLFQDQISRGNASLLLRGVKVQDEGKYKCYSSTTGGFKQSFVNVKTEGRAAFLEAINFLLVFDVAGENRFTCSSEGIYPKPEITWSTEPPSNTTALNITTSVQQTEEKLYSISSLRGRSEGTGISLLLLQLWYNLPLTSERLLHSLLLTLILKPILLIWLSTLAKVSLILFVLIGFIVFYLVLFLCHIYIFLLF